jgi:hypothetical protein
MDLQDFSFYKMETLYPLNNNSPLLGLSTPLSVSLNLATSLDECPHEVHVLKAWSQACGTIGRLWNL